MDDLISRQEAIDAIEFGITYAKAFNKETGEVKKLFQASNEELRKAEDRIKQLPSAQHTGRWKVSYLPKGKMKYCSECGFGQYIADERQYNFCPNCGADMRGEDDE